MLAVVIIILVSTLSSSPKAGKGDNPWVKPFTDTAVTNAIQRLPAKDFAQAGSGSAMGTIPSKASTNGLLKLSGPKLTQGGKPLIVYLGSEFCPYCAATRWPFTIALGRFGKFTGLQLTASSPLDIYHLTPTLTFAKAHYSSPYIALSTTEQLTNHCPNADVIANPGYSSTPAQYFPSKFACKNNAYVPLQTPSPMVSKLASSVDTNAKFGAGNGGGIPFIDFGGVYAEDGAIYIPGLLHGVKWNQIVAAMSQPTIGIGQQVLQAANRYTAMICNIDGGKPGSVCNSSVIKAAEKALG
ncbi:MAG: DUF929 family protein [Acidimicrobiales bacterium]